jgi:hypothetical protein
MTRFSACVNPFRLASSPQTMCNLPDGSQDCQTMGFCASIILSVHSRADSNCVYSYEDDRALYTRSFGTYRTGCRFLDRRLARATGKAGVNNPHKLHGMGVVWRDYDNDGWPDLFVTNDSGWNFLYRNKQDDAFEEVGITSGTGLGPFGQNYGDMAADFADFDHDGQFDLFAARNCLGSYKSIPWLAICIRRGGVSFRV